MRRRSASDVGTMLSPVGGRMGNRGRRKKGRPRRRSEDPWVQAIGTDWWQESGATTSKGPSDASLGVAGERRALNVRVLLGSPWPHCISCSFAGLLDGIAIVRARFGGAQPPLAVRADAETPTCARNEIERPWPYCARFVPRRSQAPLGPSIACARARVCAPRARGGPRGGRHWSSASGSRPRRRPRRRGAPRRSWRRSCRPAVGASWTPSSPARRPPPQKSWRTGERSWRAMRSPPAMAVRVGCATLFEACRYRRTLGIWLSGHYRISGPRSPEIGRARLASSRHACGTHVRNTPFRWLKEKRIFGDMD